MKKFMIWPVVVVIALVSISSCKQKSNQANSANKMNQEILKRENYQTEYRGKKTDLFTLKNSNGMVVQATNFGAKIELILVPDKDGKFGDVVFGYDSIGPCIDGDLYFGAVVGRYANRIAGGHFRLNGEEYQLAQNNGPNSLHGGISGFNNKVWDGQMMETDSGQAVAFTYMSADGEEGYPGNLTVKVTYTLTDDNEIIVDYAATTDKPTVINLSQHTYFNLAGQESGDVLGQQVVINADKFTPVDSTLIPTGELRPVEGTPMDFRQPHAIGERINSDDAQLKMGGGYDHNFVLNKKGSEMSFAASAYDPVSGRYMEVFTDQPGIQFYSGNFLDGTEKGKGGAVYNHRNGFCLETQHFPDSPNQPDFPSTVLNPGDEFHSQTVFKFSVKQD